MNWRIGKRKPWGLSHLGGLPGGVLRKVFGLWQEELEELPASATLPVIPHDLQPVHPATAWPEGTATGLAAVIHPEGADVLATFGPGPFIPAGRPAILRHRYGQGTAWYLGGEFDRPLLDALHATWIDQLGIPRPFPNPLPDGVIFASRNTDEVQFWFFSNLNPQNVTIQLPAGLSLDFLSGDRAGSNERQLQLLPESDAVIEVRGAPGTILSGK